MRSDMKRMGPNEISKYVQLNGVSNKLDGRVIKLNEKKDNKDRKFTNRLTSHWKTESAIESSKCLLI